MTNRYGFAVGKPFKINNIIPNKSPLLKADFLFKYC